MPRRHPPVPHRELGAFIAVVRRLRRECPWDREQTHQSIRHGLIEEVYEVVEALDDNNIPELRKELGDLLLHVVMHATIAEQAHEFTLKQVVQEIIDKLIRRHPHVFGSTKAGNATEVKHHWETLKMREGRLSLLEGIPRGMPALQRALRVQERASKVGFDWEKEGDVWNKVREEGEELRKVLQLKAKQQREEEFGDYLFALVNYARFIDVNPENALRSSIEKFTRRFTFIEQELRKRGKSPHNSTLEEMDRLWNKAKRRR
jgi:tetrapyrrole methylase family protein / MazG family protein